MSGDLSHTRDAPLLLVVGYYLRGLVPLVPSGEQVLPRSLRGTATARDFKRQSGFLSGGPREGQASPFSMHWVEQDVSPRHPRPHRFWATAIPNRGCGFGRGRDM